MIVYRRFSESAVVHHISDDQITDERKVAITFNHTIEYVRYPVDFSLYNLTMTKQN